MTKGRVLVIDDEDIVLMSCKRTLVPEGYEVKTANNPADGLRMLEAEAFDIVITDLKMPDMDGIVTLQLIKAKYPSTEVIVITGYQTVETAIKAIELGAYGYFEKPFTPEQLIEVIRNAMSHKAGQ